MVILSAVLQFSEIQFSHPLKEENKPYLTAQRSIKLNYICKTPCVICHSNNAHCLQSLIQIPCFLEFSRQFSRGLLLQCLLENCQLQSCSLTPNSGTEAGEDKPSETKMGMVPEMHSGVTDEPRTGGNMRVKGEETQATLQAEGTRRVQAQGQGKQDKC